MAVAVNSTSGSTAAAVTSLTWSHANTAGDLLAVGIAYRSAIDSSVTGVTFAGAALSSAGVRVASSLVGAEIFWLLNPSIATSTITVTLSATAGLVAHGLAVTGASGVSGYVTSTNTSTEVSVVVTSATGDLVIDQVIEAQNSSMTMTQGQTLLKETGIASPGLRGGASYLPGGASITMGWRKSNPGSTSLGIAALNIVSSGAVAAGVRLKQRLLYGVGC